VQFVAIWLTNHIDTHYCLKNRHSLSIHIYTQMTDCVDNMIWVLQLHDIWNEEVQIDSCLK
jgi:hypothetical protein